MIILAFLQNVWVKDPEGLKAIFARHPEQRVSIIRRLLFGGCLTGRRMMACFGEELLEQMIIEEASLDIAGDSRKICLPDPEHIKSCLEEYQPRIVVTFGKVAENAVHPIWDAWTDTQEDWRSFVPCPHPAARQVDTVKRLMMAAEEIRKLCPQISQMAAEESKVTPQCGG